ncbi:hypothetical protein TCE0_013r00815 [Talaromyces pinophilus]|uniref:Uncharacterized protein n=1 Tax=Talaromyces pinophilus TaxID=128442 RepID=A0A698XN77_TALPI|nr:hypothetical protein TCE0_013r00815 [Talaromyces pinophilus]
MDLLRDDPPSSEHPEHPVPPATGSWECPPTYDPDRYAPFLNHIADLTGTRVTYDELGNKIDVLGKDAAVVEQTIDRLVHLDAALSLLTPVPASHQHHMFLPSTGYEKLQITPFRHHPAAATVKTLSTPDEWSSLTTMGVLVPFRQGVRLKDMNVSTATPRPPVPSRFLSSQSFQMFGNYDMYNSTLAEPKEGSSASTAAAAVVPTPKPAEPVLALRPKEYYSILASENADRVTSWVSKATDTPVDPEQSVPLEEYPPEQKPVKGVLKRRVRQTSKSNPVKSQAKAEEDKPSDESKPAPLIPLKPKLTPTVHHTMAQKTSPGSKTPLKQATLEKFWSKHLASEKEKSNISKPELRESSPSASRLTANEEEMKPERNVREVAVPTQNDVKKVQKAIPKPVLRADSRDVLQIFNALQPTLEAARSFPGALELEARIELITIAPSTPGSGFDETVVTIDEWKEKFQCKQGNPLAPYWAWNKVTGSGTDVDAMIDMIWSKKGPQRIFHETPANQDLVFEYHCRLKDGSSTFVISLDKAGRPSFHQTPYVLGCSTIHFPHRMWDMNITLKGEMTFYGHRDPALKKAIDEFIETIWFQPGDDLTIFCSEPKNKIFLVDKILMKSTVRHKHQPVNSEMSSELMLKTVEVRQFRTGRKPGHPQLIRGRMPANRQESIAHRILWFEVSVVSGAIQKFLTANRELELGQQTQKWTSVDLLGDEIEVKDVPYDSNEVAQSIGDAGLGSMYRLAKVILDRMRIGDVVV